MSYKSKYKRTQVTTNNYQQNFNPFDRNHWGPKTWEVMHIFSYNYSDNPSLQDKQNAFNFYSSIGHMLPCSHCQEHCVQYVTDNPPHLQSKDHLVDWVLEFHNVVSTRLGKETWSRSRLDQKFETNNAFCA